MKTVWKALLKNVGKNEITLPVGSKILHVREQYEFPTLWYLCDPNEPRQESKAILVAGTNHEVPDNAEYLGTAHIGGGVYIWHAFLIP